MNEESARQFTAENPDSAVVKELVARGHKAGAAEARTAEINRLKELVAACPNRPALAIDAFIAGQDAAQVALTVKTLDAEAKAHVDAMAKLSADLEKAKFLAGGQAGVGKQAEKAEESSTDDLPAKERAEKEWDSKPDVRKGFSSKDNYVHYRIAEIEGTHRNYERPVKA